VTQITSSMAAGTVLAEGVYEVRENVKITASSAGTSGLAVKSGATVAIHIPKGVVLTVKGAAGSGKTGGGAGFRIPSGATLIVVGEGKLSATGGKAGNGSNGSRGGDGSRNDGKSHAGDGGAGGNGGGGAGAGIGGAGGSGGAGGATKSGYYTNDYYPEYSGYNGNAGSPGSNGDPMGVLYVLGSANVVAAAGALGTGGASGGEGSSYDTGYISSLTTHHGLGGGGGGGGGGIAAEDPSAIGGGGGGGGGGGSGGTGSIDWCYATDSAKGGKGQGGFGGFEEGEDGWPTEVGKATNHGQRWGGYGGGAGEPGKGGNDGFVHASDDASVDGADDVTPAETHPFLARTITLDFAGGTSGGAPQATREAYLYLSMPDVPIPDYTGHLFLGYYSGPGGSGTQYYDGTGEPLVEWWDQDRTDAVLYAHWREVTPPENPLVVTQLSDEEFNPDSSAITFRAAVTWAMLFPDLLGEDGTPSKITFASNLWAEASRSRFRSRPGRSVSAKTAFPGVTRCSSRVRA